MSSFVFPISSHCAVIARFELLSKSAYILYAKNYVNFINPAISAYETLSEEYIVFN
jgi:hypothetical protein